MRLDPSPRRGLRATLVALVGVTALFAATVAPAAAQPPGPPALPVLSGLVTNACTGLPIARGLAVAVALIDPAAPVGSPPGPPTKPPNPNFFGLFSYPTLVPGGSYQLTVSAPGYTPLGADPAAPAGSPGVMIQMPPGPPALPAGQELAIGLVLDVRLAPASPGGHCKPPNPNLQALAGRVVDSTTGRGVRGLDVGLATIDPVAPIGSPPGPPNKPPNPNVLGFFSYPTVDPGPYQLTIDAPGYTSLGADPASPAGGSPGVTLEMPPGPPNLPAGQVLNESLVLAVQMPPGPPTHP